jgi:hypothetical protein
MSKAAAVQATMRGPSWPEILHLIKDICGYILNPQFGNYRNNFKI